MSFKLEWENGIDSQYQTIYRANDPFEFDQLPSIYAMVEKGVSEFTDTAVEDFTPYYYRVASNREENGVIETVASQLVSAGYKGGPSLDLDFACEKYSIMRPNGSMIDRTFSEIITFTRSSPGGVTNEFGQYVQRANNVPRLDHDPASLTTSTSTASFEASTATFILPTGHAFFVGDLFRATAVGGSIWGIVTARSATSVTIYVRNSTGTGEASSWTCIRPLGIRVEEQRANLLLRSVNFADAAWQKVNTAAVTVGVSSQGLPINTVSDNATLASHSITQLGSASVAGGTAVAVSIFAKAGSLGHAFLGIGGTSTSANPPFISVNLATGAVAVVAGAVLLSGAVPVGDGWWRVFLVANVLATGSVVLDARLSLDGLWANRVYAGSGQNALFTGAQLELGASATSYIPTELSQVTRAADVCSVNTLSPWYNAIEGSLVAEFVRSAISPSQTFATLRGAVNSTMTLESGSGAPGQLRMRVNNAGTQQAIPIGLGSSVAGVPYKMAGAYKADYFAVSVNGGVPDVDISGTVPTATRVEIGNVNSVAFANGTISRITYFPRVIDVQQASA